MEKQRTRGRFKMKLEYNQLTIDKEDLISFRSMENNKPEIKIRGKDNSDFIIKFDNSNTYEYFALKLHRIRLMYTNPRLVDRIDTATMKAIILNKELDKVKIRR